MVRWWHSRMPKIGGGEQFYDLVMADEEDIRMYFPQAESLNSIQYTKTTNSIANFAADRDDDVGAFLPQWWEPIW